MARVSGKGGLVKMDATITAQVYAVTNWEMDYKGDTIDVTGMDSGGAKAFLGGLIEATIAVECYEDGAFPLNSDITPGAAILFELYYVNTDTSAWHGTAYVTDKKPTVELSGAVKWSISAQVSNDTTFHYAIP